jgi:hypothetical protein
VNRNGEQFDLALFEANRSRFPAKQLLSLAGKHVAWSADGTRIVASADDRAGLYAQLESAGVPVDQVVFDFIDPPDAVLLG